MYLLYFKALHIIGMVVWFSGLFYLGRLFVYHREAEELPETEKNPLKKQYAIMEKRLYFGIAWPGLCITISFGLAMLIEWGIPDWIQLKFALVMLLIGYHFWCGNIRKKLCKKQFYWSSKNLRLFNEIPTIFLFNIVFLAIFKETISLKVLLLVTIPIGIIIYLTIHLLPLRKK